MTKSLLQKRKKPALLEVDGEQKLTTSMPIEAQAQAQVLGDFDAGEIIDNPGATMVKNLKENNN